MKKLLLLIVILIFQSGFCQSYSISYTANGDLIAFEPLVKDKEIFGYVELRSMGQQDSITNIYKYIVLDKNMNPVCDGDLKENIYKKKYWQRVTDIKYNNGHVIFGFKINYYNEFSGAYYNIANSFQILNIEKK